MLIETRRSLLPCPFTVGRGPVAIGRRDIPVPKSLAPHRRARACPSPCSSRSGLAYPVFHRRAVGKPVPRHRSRASTHAGDRPPRYDKKRHHRTVGREPSHATRAGERVPLAVPCLTTTYSPTPTYPYSHHPATNSPPTNLSSVQRASTHRAGHKSPLRTR